ncbi:hypothetical protein H310_14769 [Aphanomyces invadans]|uniref:Uncharacterized protein n=1 Tax=Aphanomyces invadans TaxID=157072 RepID=A0A024TA21_9STRA|nr:hypothetical protein H310_14769 [Aphanomyces invadans]ETV90446.1 hypothetical protein H310_14769 [Aphanomyces invadans]|eukprot:XP_008880920.1 hypothetical protein H310_14769 [Aphanomyces invadans]
MNLALTRQNDIIWTATVLSLMGLLRSSEGLRDELLWDKLVHWAVFGLIFVLCGGTFLASLQILNFEPHQPWIQWLLRYPLWLSSRCFAVHSCGNLAQSLCCCSPSACPMEASLAPLLRLSECTNTCSLWSDRMYTMASQAASLVAVVGA